MTHNAQTISGYHSGDTLRITVNVEDPDGNAVDIRGTSIKYVIAGAQTGSKIIEKSTSAGGITIVDGVNGLFRIDIEPSDTADLSGGYAHECQLTDTNGDVATLFGGSINITEDIITS
jgi:hypothetical protein